MKKSSFFLVIGLLVLSHCKQRASYLRTAGTGAKKPSVTLEGILNVSPTLPFDGSPESNLILTTYLEASKQVINQRTGSANQIQYINSVRQKINSFLATQQSLSSCGNNPNLQLSKRIIAGAGTFDEDIYPNDVYNHNPLATIHNMSLAQILEVKWTLDYLFSTNAVPFCSIPSSYTLDPTTKVQVNQYCTRFQEMVTQDFELYSQSPDTHTRLFPQASMETIQSQLNNWMVKLNQQIEVINQELSQNSQILDQSPNPEILARRLAQREYEKYVALYADMTSSIYGRIIYTDRLLGVIDPLQNIEQAEYYSSTHKLLFKHHGKANPSSKIRRQDGVYLNDLKYAKIEAFELINERLEKLLGYEQIELEEFVLHHPASVGHYLMTNPGFTSTVCRQINDIEQSHHNMEKLLTIIEYVDLAVAIIPLGGWALKGVTKLAQYTITRSLIKFARNGLVVAVGAASGAIATGAAYGNYQLYKEYGLLKRELFLTAYHHEAFWQFESQIEKAISQINKELFWLQVAGLVTVLDVVLVTKEIVNIVQTLDDVTPATILVQLKGTNEALRSAQTRCNI